MSADTFTLIFLTALVLSVSLQLWLKWRHRRHVLAHRERVPAEFAAVITPDDHRKAADYTVSQINLACIAVVWEALWVLALTYGGLIAWFDSLARQWVGGGIAGGVLMIALLSVAMALVNLPFTLWATFVIEERFGFNKTTPGLFVVDMLKHAVIQALLLLPLTALVLWFLGHAGSLWWLYAWAAWVVVGLVTMAIYPTVILPWFNRFTPLEDQALKRRVEALAERGGFKASGVFVMDGSRRSSHGNAFFVGFGRTKRIVFYDTLIDKLNHDQIEAVLAHEVGHFVHRHLIKRLVVLFGIGLLFMGLLGWLKGQSWFFEGLGISTPSDAAALVLFFTAIPVFIFPFGWIASYGSRRHEYEADRYAVAQTGREPLIEGLVQMYRDNAVTLTPDPLHSLFYDSHPPAFLRIAAMKRA
ncbi:M48 family metallopeptidase [Chitinimonas lacunae]|uniref:M48 family metallopeptidase n=1 Tax=Chitinimonas lacunae TaxID=1963018 RepID=A0ABV8MRE2_9NEIS